MQPYKTFNQTLFKKLLDTKVPELEACGIIRDGIYKIHPLDFLYGMSKCGVIKKKEDFCYLYDKYIVEIDTTSPLINDLTTATL